MLFVSIRLHAYWSGDHEAVSEAEEVDEEDDDEDLHSGGISDIDCPFPYDDDPAKNKYHQYGFKWSPKTGCVWSRSPAWHFPRNYILPNWTVAL